MWMIVHDLVLVVSLLALCVTLYQRKPLRRRKARKLLRKIRGA